MKLKLILVTILFVTSIRSDTPTLLLHYTFDEGSGPAKDSSGFGTPADAELSGSAARSSKTPGQSGGYSLDLTRNGPAYASVASPDKLSSHETFSLSFWVNSSVPSYTGTTFLTYASGTGNTYIYMEIDQSGAINPGYNHAIFSVRNLESEPPSNLTVVKSSDKSLYNNWTFYAITWGGGLLRMYEGTEKQPVILDSSFATIPINRFRGNLIIGEDSTGQAKLLVDDFRYYDGAADQSFLEQVRLEGLTQVPEPSTLVLASVGGVALLLFSRAAEARRKRESVKGRSVVWS